MAKWYTEAHNKASQKYNAKTYDRVALRLKKGEKEVYSQFASENGMSLNAFIVSAMVEKMEKMKTGE